MPAAHVASSKQPGRPAEPPRLRSSLLVVAASTSRAEPMPVAFCSRCWRGNHSVVNRSSQPSLSKSPTATLKLEVRPPSPGGRPAGRASAQPRASASSVKPPAPSFTSRYMRESPSVERNTSTSPSLSTSSSATPLLRTRAVSAATPEAAEASSKVPSPRFRKRLSGASSRVT